jgi:hypothetical protein
MSFAHLMFRGITAAKIGIPIAVVALLGAGWWGFVAGHEFPTRIDPNSSVWPWAEPHVRPRAVLSL